MSSTWSRSCRPTTPRVAWTSRTSRRASPRPSTVVNLKLLHEKAKRNAFVLHSLPRMDELTEDVDETRFGRYWVEAFNGVVMRMALLTLVLGKAE